ncbi:MAG: histidine phosphatase family protein [Bifidobacterium sp.]|nr:histidine phosphatase family protein [Bifidobacterium sp.]
MTLHLYLVRHGQTMFNRYNRLQGWSNSPLTDAGREDAVRAGGRLAGIDFAAAYCSDTTRAMDTARTILDINEEHGHARPALVADMHFREQCYGYWEGQDMGQAWLAAGGPHGTPTYAAIVERYGIGATRDFLKEADPFHDAESDAEYWERIAGGYALVASNPDLHDGDNVLQISHGNTLLSLMQRFAPAGYDLTVRPLNGSVTRLDFEPDADFASAMTVVAYNEH